MTHIKIKSLKNTVEELGHNFVFHFNGYQNLWYCIPRDQYNDYWNNIKNKNCTGGQTIEEAAKKMLKNKTSEK
jgi:hypothetical protein